MYYFGYQKFPKGVHPVRFHADHVFSHRVVLQSHPISKEDFDWATWGALKARYPYTQEEKELTSELPKAS